MRDALSLLDQCSASEVIDLEAVYSAMGLAGNRRTAALMERVLAHETEKAIRDFNAMWMDGKDPSVLLTELTGLLRDALMMKVAPKGGQSLISGGYDSATLLSLGERMTKEELISAMDTLQGAQTQIRSGASPKTTAELCLVCLCDSSLSDSTSALKARISRLEEQLKNGVTVRAVPSQPDDAEEELPPPPEEEYPEPAGYAPVYPEAEEPAPVGDRAGGSSRSASRRGCGDSVTWKEIAAEAAPMLPKDISMQLDEKSVRGRLEGADPATGGDAGFPVRTIQQAGGTGEIFRDGEQACGPGDPRRALRAYGRSGGAAAQSGGFERVQRSQICLIINN